MVELVSDRLQVLRGMNRQVGAFGKVLAQKTVGVLVRTALPGLALFAEEHRATQVRADFPVPRHLDALVPGD